MGPLDRPRLPLNRVCRTCRLKSALRWRGHRFRPPKNQQQLRLAETYPHRLAGSIKVLGKVPGKAPGKAQDPAACRSPLTRVRRKARDRRFFPGFHGKRTLRPGQPVLASLPPARRHKGLDLRPNFSQI